MSKAKSSSEFGSKYVSFQDEIDEDIHVDHPDVGSSASTIELVGNGSVVGSGEGPRLPKRIRLRAVESEREYFLNQMNVNLFRKLIILQVVAAILIVVSQVVLYAIVTRYNNYKVLDYVGVGLWGPLVFFSVGTWLAWSTTKSPSGCCIGAAMGFQITSIIVGLFLLILSCFSLAQHGQYNYWSHNDGERVQYDPEVTGRIFCSLMILSVVGFIVAAIITSVQYCKLTCCARANAHETVLFDVETIKV